MNWEPTWLLYGCVLLNAVAGLLLIAIDGIRPPRSSKPKGQKGVKRGPRRPRFHAEDQLVNDLKRWRHEAAGGENLPLAADTCRNLRGRMLNRSVG